ncbi:MAG: hypothetical protein MdMp024_0035 [Bacteroidales bacterium]
MRSRRTALCSGRLRPPPDHDPLQVNVTNYTDVLNPVSFTDYNGTSRSNLTEYNLTFLPADAHPAIIATFTAGQATGSATIVVDGPNKQLDITGAADMDVLTFTVDWMSSTDASHSGKVFSTGTNIWSCKVNWPDSLSIDGDTTIVQGQSKQYKAHPSPESACHVVNASYSQTNSNCSISSTGVLSVGCNATGTTTVGYTCKKGSGTVSGSKTVTIIVPTASITGPSTLQVNEVGTYTVTTNYGGSYTFNFSSNTPGTYTVGNSVTSDYGCSYYASMRVTVEAPSISISADTTTPTVGQTVTLTATASPSGGSYQWYAGGAPILGATGNTYSHSEGQETSIFYNCAYTYGGTAYPSNTVRVDWIQPRFTVTIRIVGDGCTSGTATMAGQSQSFSGIISVLTFNALPGDTLSISLTSDQPYAPNFSVFQVTNTDWSGVSGGTGSSFWRGTFIGSADTTVYGIN